MASEAKEETKVPNVTTPTYEVVRGSELLRYSQLTGEANGTLVQCVAFFKSAEHGEMFSRWLESLKRSLSDAERQNDRNFIYADNVDREFEQLLGGVGWFRRGERRINEAIAAKLSAAEQRAEEAERENASLRSKVKQLTAEFEKVASGTHPRYWTLEPGDALYRATGETRPAHNGEWWEADDGSLNMWKHAHETNVAYPIYRRIDAPADATSGEKPPVVKESLTAAPAPPAEEGERRELERQWRNGVARAFAEAATPAQPAKPDADLCPVSGTTTHASNCSCGGVIDRALPGEVQPAKPEMGKVDDLVEIAGKRYRREMVDFVTELYNILHEITDEPAPSPHVETGGQERWAVEAAKVRPSGRLEFVVYRASGEMTQEQAEAAARDIAAMAAVRKHGITLVVERARDASRKMLFHSHLGGGHEFSDNPADAILSLASQLSASQNAEGGSNAT